ncbi:MAG: efflux transporter periplasmic adaptor subunit [Rhodobiaceae bacterium]|nr:MAG: efflux transporter periplasmic adaptor subunit [Rhodobiaceae bacterium]
MNRTSVAIVSFLLVVAMVVGFAIARFVQNDEPMVGAEASNGERVISHWVAPMDPNFRRDGPGKSPMGMDLIPVYRDENGGSADHVPSLRIDPAVVNNIGVRTAEVLRGPLYRQISTVGFVAPNENNLGHVHVRTPGWIEELKIRTVGEVVNAGDLLFRFYSPDLVSAQAEYLQTRRRGNGNLTAAARERLIALGLTKEQIDNISKTGRAQRLVDVRAHQSGTVLELGVREGKYVDSDDMIMNMADLSSVWVLVDIFEDEASWVESGQTAKMRLGFVPGKVWEGVVDYVYPTVDTDSRTVRARIVFENPDGMLKPGMYADLTIDTDPKLEALTIPQSALIRASTSDRVILALGDGRFRPAQVVVGIESGGRAQILEGLSVGEHVVIAGQFLIDSEASLDAALLRLTTPDAHGEHQ